MDALLNLINQPIVPWIIAIIIICLAILLWFSFSLALMRIMQQLKKVQNLFNGHDPLSFAEHYAEIDAQLQKQPLITQQWQAYRQTLLPARQADTPIYYTQTPQTYFNISTLIESRINLRLYQAVPNILVGIGIWFTFIGLVAALWFASQGVAADDINQAQQSLRDLLYAATFKFVTSIAGLLASIVFSWAEKSRLHRLNKQLERLNQHISHCMLLRTSTQLQALQLQETQKQTQQLKQYLGQSLGETVGVHLQQAVQPLAHAIEGLGDKISRLNQDALTELLERFSQQVQGAAGNELKQLADTLQHLVFSLNEFKKGFEQTGVGVGTEMQNAASTLNTVQGHFAQLGDDLLQRLAQTSEDLHRTSQNLHAAGAPLAETANRFQLSLEQLQKLMQTLQNAGETLTHNQQEAAKNLRHTEQQVQQVWSNYQQRFENVDNDLGQVFKALSQGLDHYRQQVEQFTSRLDDSLNQSVKALNGVIGELVEALEEIQNQSRKKPANGDH